MDDGEDPISFRALLRHHRLEARLTQEGLAARCGLGARTIQNLERGVNQPRPETLGLLVTCLRLADEARDHFVDAAQPIARGPRGHPTRVGGRDRASKRDMVRLADRRHEDPVATPIPPAKSPGDPIATPAPRVLNNLPVQWTSFVGREQALRDAAGLLESNHLLTLTGAGGCGKSRLALEIARRLTANYPDGVWLIELAPLTDPALVGQAIASVLGLRETTGKPIAQTLIEHLCTEKTLLVVDNCEHLIEGAAPLIDVILHACPRVRVLATSREALRTSGEADWRVPSLAVPVVSPNAAVEDIADVESVRLFVERGRAVRTDFGVTSQNARAIAQICRRLDGIPLAIELAATQVSVLPVAEIAARLDERFGFLTGESRLALPRHRTLAALVDWSYDLLSDAGRNLFNRLSVFAGGFTLEAAKVVCGGSEKTIAHLSELVRKSMVIATGGTSGVERYDLLETLRQYGQERLVAVGEHATIQQRHATYYLKVAEEIKPRLFQPEQLVYLARLDRESDNFRAAFRWYIDHEEAEAGLRLAAALEFYFWYRGTDEGEGQSWRTRLVNLRVPFTASAARANALLWTASTTLDWEGLPSARRWFRDALMMARQVGDQRTLAWVMHRTSRYGGPDQETWYGASQTELAEGAWALFQASDDRWGAAISQAWLGYLEYHRGNTERARLLLAAAVVGARALGERHCIAFALRNLGEVTMLQSPADAELSLRESLRHYHELSDVQGVAYVELLLGRLDCFLQNYSSACRHYRASLCMYQEVTAKEYMVQCLAGLAIVAAGQGKVQRTIRLTSAAQHLSTWTKLAAYPIERADLDHALTLAQEAFDTVEGANAMTEGRAMTLAQAISYALQEDNG